ncbi:MAG: hypothetical protein ACX932_03425 [Gammaproteobacteria bacterium]
MDILIQQLRDGEHVTTEQAVQVLFEITTKYSNVLSNIIAIKEKKPEGEGFVRGGARSSSDLLKELLETLQTLNAQLMSDSKEWINDEGASSADNALANEKILSLLQSAIKKMHLSYQGKAKSFAIILTELESIHDILAHRFTLPRKKHLEKNAEDTKGDESEMKRDISVGEKYVYARIYHRSMEFLGTNKASVDWLPPLLQALKDPERHGIAIYEDEENIIKSLKDDKYGYVMLQIHEKQDITAKRPLRKDPQLQCPLLTIAEVNIQQIIQLVHLGKRYPIVAGKIQGFKRES